MARVKPARCGAGLEVDLAAPRRVGALPAELRSRLPREGIVNHVEAQAVVDSVIDLLADHEFVAGAQAWQSNRGHSAPAIAVIALYPAQAALIGCLLEDATRLQAAPVRVEVGTPESFRQRDCFAALISLTRSHVHRAVSYGESPHQLALALTRAAGRVFLFGDPGTLIRRCQWQGAVDHLSEQDATSEREFFTRLLRYLQGHGKHASAFTFWQHQR